MFVMAEQPLTAPVKSAATYLAQGLNSDVK